MKKVTVPEGRKGQWRVEKFHVSEEDSVFSYLRGRGRGLPAGHYTRLKRGSTLVMSDSLDEMDDHRKFVDAAHGDVLIAGLGIGMVLQAVLDKDDVKHVTVLEISQDLIDLVGPHYTEKYGDKLTIVCADAYEFDYDGKWHCAWFDIWDYMTLDNIDQMEKIHHKAVKSCGWMGFWSELYLHARYADEIGIDYLGDDWEGPEFEEEYDDDDLFEPEDY